MSDDQKSPVDQALDLFVFAPIGLLSMAREQLPSLVERGRQRIENQMVVARMMGEYAVKQGREDAEKAVRDVVDRVSPPPPAPVVRSDPAPAPEPAPAAAPAASTDAPAASPAPATNGSSPASSEAPTAPRPDAGHLAIPGYDTLSASQVVPRLAGLAPAELEDVRAYEASTRGRRTILNKVAQLQAASKA